MHKRNVSNSQGSYDSLRQTSSRNQSQGRQVRQPMKWVRAVRSLPSNPESNDFLKVDFIENNLNNSRKLISNINSLANTSREAVTTSQSINENFMRLSHLRNELRWVEEI
ncbi:uncharacterized protein PRCAT00004405001 [Priceomyces carsonii]|uniref:uncharacterized protein n=1 Tax=Priceomyces carsonii TaxID=28549 RepID=UPI002EDB6FFD|nr:unnamed protein product [Priceomyces carsonii]